MSVRRASTHLLHERFVHLHIVPRPSNLSESREIFRVLQRFGEISKYYSLQFEYHSPAPNSALLIYREKEAAQKALDASPIRFALETTEPRLPDDASKEDLEKSDDASPPPTTPGIDDILRPSALLTRPRASPPTPPTPAPLPFARPSTPQKTVSKWFQVTVDRSRAIHQDYVERQPYWKQFNPMKSTAQEDLAKKVPTVGLSDVSKRPPHSYRTPNKVLRLMNEHLSLGNESLMGMWTGSKGRGGPDR